MIISRTPLRLSFFGGGTDYPAWYREQGGAVLATAINKYSYITCRYLPPVFGYRNRIRYYHREETNTIEEIRHPSIRASLQAMKIEQGVDIVHHGDLPARSGLGSSSSFTVGLLNALHALTHRMPTKRELAMQAIDLEQNVLQENVGSQDQTTAAFGGLNRIEFGGPHEIEVKPMILAPERIQALERHVLLAFTGLAREASEVAAAQVSNIGERRAELRTMYDLVGRAEQALTRREENLRELGRLLAEQWTIKRTLTRHITSPDIDAMHAAGMKAGAWGGKLLGAGGGGFMLFLAPPETHAAIGAALPGKLCVPVRFDFLGSQIVYYSHDDA